VWGSSVGGAPQSPCGFRPCGGQARTLRAGQRPRRACCGHVGGSRCKRRRTPAGPAGSLRRSPPWQRPPESPPQTGVRQWLRVAGGGPVPSARRVQSRHLRLQPFRVEVPRLHRKVRPVQVPHARMVLQLRPRRVRHVGGDSSNERSGVQHAAPNGRRVSLWAGAPARPPSLAVAASASADRRRWPAARNPLRQRSSWPPRSNKPHVAQRTPSVLAPVYTARRQSLPSAVARVRQLVDRLPNNVNTNDAPVDRSGKRRSYKPCSSSSSCSLSPCPSCSSSASSSSSPCTGGAVAARPGGRRRGPAPSAGPDAPPTRSTLVFLSAR